MARSIVVMDAFLTADEAAQSAGLAKGVEVFVVATGEELVDVALMRDVEDEPVLSGVERQVQGDRQFHYAQVRSDVPAICRSDLDNASPQLSSQLIQFVLSELSQVGGALDLVKQGHATFGSGVLGCFGLEGGGFQCPALFFDFLYLEFGFMETNVTCLE